LSQAAVDFADSCKLRFQPMPLSEASMSDPIKQKRKPPGVEKNQLLFDAVTC
jgi:hypothetical protein